MRSKIRRRQAFLLCAVLCAAAGIAILTAWQAQRVYQAPGPLAQESRVYIPYGKSLGEIAHKLEAAEIIDSRHAFLLAVRLLRLQGKIQAGEYLFPPKVSLHAVVAFLSQGRSSQRLMTFLEGWSSQQIVDHLNAEDTLEDAIAAAPPEGSLLPDTYGYNRGDQRQMLLDRMRLAMDELLAQLWQNRADDLIYDHPQEAVILASIIEKEALRDQERPIIARVFINRLRKGMRLEADPTVIYALTQGKKPLGRALTRKDLEIKNPYNTYKVKGLPPTPISNPGIPSLTAAFHPSPGDWLYFVADGKGGHRFSVTYAEHRRNVAAYRAQRRQRRQPQPPTRARPQTSGSRDHRGGGPVVTAAVTRR